MRALVVAQQLRQPAPGGIGTYTRELVRAVQTSGHAEVTLLASSPPAAPDPLGALGPVVASRLSARLLVRAWSTGVVGAPGGFDVMHACSLAFPGPPSGTPAVVAVHDVAWRSVPDAYPRHGRRWHESALRRAQRQATTLAVPTSATADSLRAGPQGGAARIDVVYPMYGCDHLPSPNPEATARLLQRLGVDGSFLLSVGTLQPRKNLARIFEAYRNVRTALPERWPLVVVGAAGWGEGVPPVEGVVLAGPVDDVDLAGLYRSARCLVYAPLTEGWGLPPVEAMAAGTPVVASPMPSIGEAALSVEPTDVDGLGAAIVRATTDEACRDELRDAGLARAGELTWARAAAAHVELWGSLRD